MREQTRGDIVNRRIERHRHRLVGTGRHQARMICAPVKVATVRRRRRCPVMPVGSSSSSTLMFTVAALCRRHVVLDRHRRAGVNDDAVAVKVGRHEHRGQAQRDRLRVTRSRRQRRMVDLIQQREGEHVVRRAQHRVAPAVCTSVNTVRAPATPFTCVGLMTSNRMLTPCEYRPVSTRRSPH